MNDQSHSAITAVRLPDGSLSIHGPRGAVIVVNGRMTDVMRLQFGGHLIGKMMALALTTIDETAAREAEFALVIDAESQSGYEPEVRALVTAWLVRHREKLRPAHLLGRAPMVKMWARMVNRSLGSEVFKIYDDRSEFDRNVGEVVRDSERMRAARRA